MVCPKCGNDSCQIITENKMSSGKGFSLIKSCCGAIMLGPIGILCGACNKGVELSSSSYWVCNQCGHKFKA